MDSQELPGFVQSKELCVPRSHPVRTCEVTSPVSEKALASFALKEQRPLPVWCCKAIQQISCPPQPAHSLSTMQNEDLSYVTFLSITQFRLYFLLHAKHYTQLSNIDKPLVSLQHAGITLFLFHPISQLPFLYFFLLFFLPPPCPRFFSLTAALVFLPLILIYAHGSVCASVTPRLPSCSTQWKYTLPQLPLWIKIVTKCPQLNHTYTVCQCKKIFFVLCQRMSVMSVAGQQRFWNKLH